MMPVETKLELGSVSSYSCSVNVGDSHHYMEILSHEASKLWDWCLRFEIVFSYHLL